MTPSLAQPESRSDPASPSTPVPPPGRWLPELIAFLALGLGILAVVRAWPDLPARVPTHFGISGEPDGWGGRGTILLLPGVSFVMYLMLSVVQRIPASWYNFPVAITEENRALQYRLARGLIVWMKAVVMCLFAHITIVMLQTALGHAQGLGPWIVWGWVAAVFALVGVYLTRAVRAR